ncbi:AMP-binding protein [Nakamurella sp. YIM 132087]|uniref:AMP-binding protein n=1 Tax=Nakamurella alba TaxID=2665158 RepID=A0A7K1FH21_9ACTN|nr:class I adenylate-forming enzyme family protein [Nakamurella alba]MTD13427.1 AMP-binding protein [Nakamurella alba]
MTTGSVHRPSAMVTMGDALDHYARTDPAATAIAFPTERATAAEFADLVRRHARSLHGLGVRHGDRVGTLLPNDLDQLALIFAAVTLGAVATPVNTRFKSRELRQVVTHSGMCVLVTGNGTGDPQPGAPDFAALVRETFPDRSLTPELRTVVCLDGDAGPDTLDRAAFAAAGAAVGEAGIDEAAAAVGLTDTALLVYTSGTTSMPKGALISHQAICRMADAIVHDRFSLTPQDSLWTSIPLFHAGAITYALTAFRAGCRYVHCGHFDAARTPEQLEREQVSVAIPGFETIWLPTLDRPDLPGRDLSRLRVVVVTGVPERLRQMAARLPHVTQLSTVGMTEACAFVAVGRTDDPFESRMTTGGHPMTGMQARIVDPETGADLPDNTPGELLVKGESLFDGYFRDPEVTAAVFDDEGWFHTGDVCSRDTDGRLTFLTRLKDMLKVGGENVSAAEVENYLVTHPAVLFAQVVSAPDAYYTEVPAAFVQLVPGTTLDEQQLIDFCIGELATYRIPRYVRFVDDWPMSGTKIKKVVLRQVIADELAAAGITEAPRIRSRKDTP